MMPGAPVADAVLADVRARTEVLVAAGHVPGLATLLVGDDPASAGYIRMKQEKAAELGFTSPHVHLPSNATQADVLAVISDFNSDTAVDAMLFQHPAPRHIDYDAALATIDPDKDVDGMQPRQRWASRPRAACAGRLHTRGDRSAAGPLRDPRGRTRRLHRGTRGHDWSAAGAVALTEARHGERRRHRRSRGRTKLGRAHPPRQHRH